MPIRVLVTGGREFRDRELVYSTLDALHGREVISLIIHGAARGADTLAKEWAKARSVPDDPHKVTQEEWDRYGSAAGPMRNRRMLIKGNPDLVVAFPGGPGTRDMIRQAEGAGVMVTKVNRP